MKHVLEYRWKRESDWHKKHKHVFDSQDGSIEEQKEKWEGEFGHLVKDREVIVQNDPITSPDPVPAGFTEEYPNYDAWLYPEMFDRYRP